MINSARSASVWIQTIFSTKEVLFTRQARFTGLHNFKRMHSAHYFMNLMNRLLVKKVRCPKGVDNTRLVFEGQSQNRILGIVKPSGMHLHTKDNPQGDELDSSS